MRQVYAICLILAMVLLGKFINIIPIPEVAVFIWIVTTFGVVAGVFYLIGPIKRGA